MLESWPGHFADRVDMENINLKDAFISLTRLIQESQKQVIMSNQKMIDQLEATTQALIGKVESLEQEQHKIKEEVHVHMQTVEKKIDKITNAAAELQEGFIGIIRDEIHENERRKRKRNNFLIMGVNDENDHQKDEKFVMELLPKLTAKVYPNGPNRFHPKVSRVGKEGKTRPILVVMENAEEKEQVLAEAKIRLPELSGYSNVYLKPDLTIIQREAMQRREQRQQRTPDTNLSI